MDYLDMQQKLNPGRYIKAFAWHPKQPVPKTIASKVNARFMPLPVHHFRDLEACIGWIGCYAMG